MLYCLQRAGTVTEIEANRIRAAVETFKASKQAKQTRPNSGTSRSAVVSKAGIEQAEDAFRLKGWTLDYLAGRIGCTRQPIIKFFARKRIEKRLFQDICNELDLNWKEIVELDSAE